MEKRRLGKTPNIARQRVDFPVPEAPETTNNIPSFFFINVSPQRNSGNREKMKTGKPKAFAAKSAEKKIHENKAFQAGF
jgi:hypothetical protein